MWMTGTRGVALPALAPLALLLLYCPALLSTARAPLTTYDQRKYELEDAMISESWQPFYWDTLKSEHPVAQPLNFRLPFIPTPPPRFPGDLNITIVATPGSTVVLPCRILDLGGQSLFWIRQPDLTVLTSGEFLFSSSPRLKLLHSPGSPDWNLQIGPVTLDDSGIYECQVNTDPKLSRVVELTVMRELTKQGEMAALALQSSIAGGEERTEQRTEILAPDDMTVTEGGSVTLECVVTEHNIPPSVFTWYIGDRALDFHLHRGGILLQEERKTRSSASKLTIARMERSDSGVYTCSPMGSESAAVEITVLPAEEERTIFSSSSNTPKQSFGVWIILFYLKCHL